MRRVAGYSNWFALIWLFASLGSGPAAAASPTDLEQAKAHFKKAETHYYVGEFATAVTLYSEAYKVKSFPGFLFNIAQCHRHLRQFRQAILFYKLYLSKSPDVSPAHRAEVEGFISQSEQGAKLQAEAGQSSMPVAPQPQSPPGSPLLKPDAPEDGLPDSRQARGRAAIWLWAGVGVSAALLTVGAVTGVVAQQKNQAYRDPATSEGDARELKNAGQPLGVASVVTLGLGGAAAVATALHYWFNYRPLSRKPGAVSTRPVVGSAVSARPVIGGAMSARPVIGGAVISFGGGF